VKFPAIVSEEEIGSESDNDLSSTVPTEVHPLQVTINSKTKPYIIFLIMEVFLSQYLANTFYNNSLANEPG
jgi:hypothetical protein